MPHSLWRERRSRSSGSLSAVLDALFRAVCVAAIVLGGGPSRAAVIYWDNSGGTANDWGSVANWSTVLAGGTDPAAIPGTADIATFSATPIQGTAQTVNLSGTRSVLGLDFLAANIAATTLQGGGTNQTLTLGTSGITMAAGAGAVTIGSATTGQQVAVTLGGAQSWTNNSSNLLTVTNGVTNGGNLLTVTGSGNTTILGIIAGTGGITKTGTGRLTLSGANTYSGTTTVSGGTLVISGATNTGAGNVSVTTGSSLTIATGGSLTTTGTLSSGTASGNVITVQSGATVNVGTLTNAWGTNYTVDGSLTSTGTWTVSTNLTTNTFNGAGTISAAALTLGNASTGVNYTGTGTINISGAVTVASTNASGNASYTQTSGTLNAGTVSLGDNVANTAGSRTFSLNGGRVNVGSGGIASTGTTTATRTVNLGAGTLGASADWSSSLAMVLTSATPGVTINTLDSGNGTTARTITLSGILSGTGSITKAGAGLLTLSGANTYTGVTTLSAGTLRATTSAQALGTGVATLSLGGGTLELANNGNLNFARNTTVTANTAITADRLASAGTTTTHTLGTLSIAAQTLSINRGGNITGTATGGITFGAATLTGAATFSPQANAVLTFSSTTGLGTHTLTKSGAGSMTLTGVVSGSKTAGQTSMSISDGLLTASGANTFTGNIAVSGSGVFAMPGATYTTTAPYGTVSGGTAYKQLLLTNGGTFRLTSGTFNNNKPSATNIAAGIIFNIGTGGATLDIADGASLVIDDGSGTGTGTDASQIQGSGTITKTGLGTFQQDDSTGFAGAIIIAEGTFQPATGNAGGATSAGTTIQSGARYNVNGVTMTNQEPLTISGAGLASAPAGALTNASGTAATWVGPVTLGGAATIGSSAGGGLTLSSTATVNTAGNVLTFTTSGSGRIFTDGVISGAGAVVFNSTSTGDYVPRADHTYGGGTTLSSGLVAVDRDSTGPAGAPTAGAFGTGTLTLAGSQLRAGAGADRTVGNVVTLSADTTFYTVASEKNLTFSGPVTLTGGNRTLTVNTGTTVPGTATIFSGAIGDAGANLGLTKAGTGTLVLGGANTYTGGTTVTSGTLVVTGSLSNYTLTLAPATAGGAGVSFASNAANTPANFTSLTLGNATGPAILGLDLGTVSEVYSTLAAATATGAIQFSINPATGFGPGTYTLLNAASGLTSNASPAVYSLAGGVGGYSYSLNTSDTQIQLNVTAGTAGARYWRGAVAGSNWGSVNSNGESNWTSDAAGTTLASLPNVFNSVYFSSENATGPGLTSTLANDFVVNDLEFLPAPTGVSSVALTPGIGPTGNAGSLTITTASGTDGIGLAQGAGAVTISAPITLGAPQTWSVDSSTPVSGTASSLSVSGPISGSAANGITFTTSAGTAPIVLAAALSTYSGASTISASTIVQGGATNGFSPNTAWTVGGTLNTGAFNQNTGSLVGGAGIVQNGSGTNATLTIGSDNLATATFAGTIQNGSTGTLGLTKAGTGTQVLSGANSYTGATTVTGGTLRAGNTSALGTVGALTVTSPGTLDLGGFNNTVGSLAASTGTLTDSSPAGSGGILQITGNATTAIAATVTGSIGFQYQNNNGSNALFSNASNTYSGGTYLGIGTNRARYTPAASATVGNGIGAALTAGIFGTGPIHIGRTPTDQGQIYLSSGTVTINNPITYNSVLGADVVGGVRLQTTTDGVFNGVQTAGLSAISIGAHNTAGAVTINGKLTGSGVFSGLIQNSNGNIGSGYVIGTEASLIIGATNTGVATVILKNASSNSDYIGDTWITATGVLQTDIANQLPTGPGTGNLYLAGTFNLQGTNQATGGLSGAGTIDGVSGTPTLTIGGNDSTGLTFSGVIQNTGGSTLTLAKIGSGTQTLSGASTFGGPVNVNGGLIAFATSPAASGPLGNSSVVNLSGGGISFTAASTNALNRSIAIGAGNGTVDVASAAGTLTVPGASVTSTGGSLVKTGAGVAALSGTTTLNGGLAGVVVNGGVLRAGFGTGGIGSIAVSGSGNLAFQNSVIETLTLGSSGTVLNLSNGARLGFELDGSTSDSITVPTGGGISLGGGFTFDFFGAGGGVSPTTYTLLTAPAGSALNTFTYTLGTAPLGYNYSFLTSDTQVQLQTVAYTPIYWTGGGSDGSWATAANFASNDAGTTPAGSPPLATETVIFNATTAVGPTVATTLDGPTTVDSLQFNGAGTPSTTVATIAPGTGGTLTLKPASASGGIAILSGGGSTTISAAVTLDNTLAVAQAWSVVDAASTLTLSGDVVFGANVNKSGAGTVVLGGSNSGAGNFSLNAGGLRLNSAGALGTGALSLAAGTTLDNTSGGGVTLTGNGPVNINGDFTFTGSGGLNLGSGAVTLSGNPTVTVAASTLTLGGAVGGTSSLTKAGAGSLVLNGARSFPGALTVGGGTLTLGGNSTGSGTVTLNAGALNLGHAGALGTGAFVIAGGTTLDNTSGGPLTNANANATTVNGSFAFLGTDDLNLGSGAIGLSATPTITVAAKTLTLAGNITGGTLGLSKSGPGSLTLGGTNVYTGNTIVNGGTLNITGSITGTTTANGSRLDYGTTAGTTVVNHSGSLTAWVTRGADVAGAVSVFNQTAGTVTIVPTNGEDRQYLANNGGYGMLNITGGTFNTGRFDGTGATNGNGSTAIIYVGGAGSLTQNVGDWFLPIRNSGMMSMTIAPGGTFTRAPAVTDPFSITGLSMSSTNNLSYGILNVAGGSVDTGVRGVNFSSGTFASGTFTSTGFVNVSGGTLLLGRNTGVGAAAGTTEGYFNFVGGTLRATATMTAVIPASTANYTFRSTIFGPVTNNNSANAAFNSQIGSSSNFAGGLVVDTNSFSVTFSNPLLGADGTFGVTQPDITIPSTGNSGYAGAPMVQFAAPNAGGTPASGYALISGGQVTGIVITNPGTYAAGETPQITLTGGGGAIAPFSTAALSTANTAAGITKNGAGTLTLSGANTYTGPTVITAGTLQLGAAGTSGSLSPSSTISNSGTLTFNRTNTVTQGSDFAATIGGSGGLTQAGNGTLVLNGANTYTGPTTLTAGTLSVNGSQNLGAPAANLVFDGGTLQITGTALASLSGIGHAVSFNSGRAVGLDISDPAHTFVVDQALTQGTGGLSKLGAGAILISQANTYSGTTTIDQGTLTFTADQALTGGLVFGAANGATNNGRLDLSAANAAFASLLVRTNSATANMVTVGAGETFTISGNVTLGYDAGGGTGATRSNLTVSGAGGMAVTGTTITIGTNQASESNAAYWNDATLDVSGLSDFSTNVTTFNIGVGGNTQGPGTVLLSNAANTIVATTLTVGDTGGNNGRGPGTLVFGTGTNVVQADTIQIGRGKNSGNGSVRFVSQVAGSPGTVVITNKAGTGAANITVGSNGTTASTGGGAVGTFDLRGHVATVTAGTMTIGTNNMNGGSLNGSVTGTVSFDAGLFTVNTLNIGPKTGDRTGGAIGTLNVGGGSFTVNAGGSFTLGSQATAGTSTATLNLTGGTFTSNVDILDGGGASTSAINLDGGILDMAGRSIGNATNVINALTLASGTLRHVAQINNGAAITKTTVGTLALTGTSSYTGQTIVQAGTLSFDTIANVGGGSSALGAPATVGNGTIALGSTATGATLRFIGGSTANTDRVLDLAATTGGVTLDASGTAPITFASGLTASGAGSKSLTLAGTNTGANTLGGVIPDNSPTNTTALVKTGTGRWILSAANTYTGGTTVNGGTLALSGSGTLGGSPVMVDGGTLDLGGLATTNVINYQSGALANANLATTTNVLGGASLSTNGLTLGGTVNVTGTLGGSGTVGLITGSGVIGPGNSPGILTASQLDFSGGIDQKFEFTSATVFPTWSDSTASVNDVLRLTNANPFNGTSATAANAFDVYFNVAGLGGSETFYGGIFTDATVAPSLSLTNATFNYFVRGDGGGSIPYKGTNYYTLAQYNALTSSSLTVTMGAQQISSADFAGGTVTNGYVQTMLVVPEPSGLVLLATALLGASACVRRRRSRQARLTLSTGSGA